MSMTVAWDAEAGRGNPRVIFQTTGLSWFPPASFRFSSTSSCFIRKGYSETRDGSTTQGDFRPS